MKILPFLVAVALIMSCREARAESIIKLKSGATVKGTIIEETDDYVKINSFDTALTFWKDEIENVTEEKSVTKEAKDTSTLKGTVSFAQYGEGGIRISAFDSLDKKTRTTLAETVINKPGRYSLKIPSNVNEVYVGGYYDVNKNQKYDAGDIIFWHGADPRTPIQIKGQEVSGINLSPHSQEDALAITGGQ